jgi:capsular exopolysaccharide synthesis family protein
MDAAPFFSLIRRWWWLCLLGAIVAVAAYGVTSRVRDRNAGPPQYRATVTLIVSSENEGADASAQLVDRPWDMDRLMATYAEIIESDTVASRAATELGDPSLADEIGRNVSVDTPGYTQVLRVTARADSAAAAERLAGAIAWSANAVREERATPGVLTLFEATAASAIPDDSTPAWLAVIVVALGGALGAAAMVIAFEYTTDSVRDARDVERVTGLPVLATIPSHGRPRATVMSTDAGDRVAGERYRMLRTAFGIKTSGQDARTVVVSGPAHGCRSAEIATNFALAAAQTGRHVALVDANLRTPELHAALGIASNSGLADALAGDFELDTAAMPSAPGVAFIAAGTVPANPSELLDSSRFRALVAQLRERFELIVFDTPPALAFTDASIVASQCDAAIVAVRAERSTHRDATACVEVLRRSGSCVVGIALTEDRGVAGLPALTRLPLLRRLTADGSTP